MPLANQDLPKTLGELRASPYWNQCAVERTVKDEIRQNLIVKLQAGTELFPGIIGYEDSVVPQVVNAVLAKHNFILLGLRGQAKTRLVRMLTSLLDEVTPYVAGSEIHDHPVRPVSKYAKMLLAEKGEETPIAWLRPVDRYVEKLATPDVTIADMIGDIDPIKAARSGQDIANELVMHYGLLPRANRGIFAINELPDLAGKIQVGLFNILEEGDVQIKGFPVRLPLDLLMVFTANPEDYTARGKIITPLKDRIGSEIRTHYPVTVEQGMAVTTQEAWTNRTLPMPVEIPDFIREVVETIAFVARDDKRIDKRSGVSQRLPISVLESVLSNAERRALVLGDGEAVPRIGDIYSALPAITGKIELEYEGELKGGDVVAKDLVRMAVGRVFTKYFEDANLNSVVKWFELGGTLKLDEMTPSEEMFQQLSQINGLMERLRPFRLGENSSYGMRASSAEFVLEGLYAHRRISRSEEQGFLVEQRKKRERTEPEDEGSKGRRQQFQ